MDPELTSAQQALQVAQTNLDDARKRYNDAAQKYDSTPTPSATDLANNYDPSALAQKNLQEAAVALGKSETEYATSARQLSIASGNVAARTQSPETKAQLTAQAHLYDDQAKLAAAEAGVVGAKSQTDLATAQANLLNAKSNAERTAAEVQTLLPAQAANLMAQGQLAIASAGEASVRSSLLIPAQAAAAQGQAAVANAQVTQEIPAQVKQILASAGLSDAQASAIWQKIGQPQQITTGLDQPSLVFQNPDGHVSSQPNPAYQATTVKLLQNKQDTVAQIQSMLEKGQIGPSEAQTYMDALDQQIASAMRGTTPFAEATQRQNYTRDAAMTGRELLTNRVAQGTSLAQSLIQSIKPTGANFDFSKLNPFDLAKGFVTDLGGGQGVADTASALVQGLQGGGGAPGQTGQVVTAPDGMPHDMRWGPISQPLSSYAAG